MIIKRVGQCFFPPVYPEQLKDLIKFAPDSHLCKLILDPESHLEYGIKVTQLLSFKVCENATARGLWRPSFVDLEL